MICTKETWSNFSTLDPEMDNTFKPFPWRVFRLQRICTKLKAAIFLELLISYYMYCKFFTTCFATAMDWKPNEVMGHSSTNCYLTLPKWILKNPNNGHWWSMSLLSSLNWLCEFFNTWRTFWGQCFPFYSECIWVELNVIHRCSNNRWCKFSNPSGGQCTFGWRVDVPDDRAFSLISIWSHLALGQLSYSDTWASFFGWLRNLELV